MTPSATAVCRQAMTARRTFYDDDGTVVEQPPDRILPENGVFQETLGGGSVTQTGWIRVTTTAPAVVFAIFREGNCFVCNTHPGA